MPGTHIRKFKQGLWNENDLQKAFKAVKNSKMTVYKASQIFKITNLFRFNKLELI